MKPLLANKSMAEPPALPRVKGFARELNGTHLSRASELLFLLWLSISPEIVAEMMQHHFTVKPGVRRGGEEKNKESNLMSFAERPVSCVGALFPLVYPKLLLNNPEQTWLSADAAEVSTSTSRWHSLPARGRTTWRQQQNKNTSSASLSLIERTICSPQRKSRFRQTMNTIH